MSWPSAILVSHDFGKCRPFLNGKGCNSCLVACPLGIFLSAPQPFLLVPGRAIDHYKIFVAQPALCNGCRRCVKVCPAGAIEVQGGSDV